MDCKFVVGQKVVCIRGFDPKLVVHKDAYLPKVGEVLTIIEIYKTIYQATNYIGLLFDEIHGSIFDDRGEVGYEYSFFAPLIERKTDISVFQKILIDASKELENV